MSASLLLSLVPILASLAPQGVDPRLAAGETLDALHRAASQADGERYFELFTEDAVFLGTDAGERWSVADFRAYAEPFFSRGQGWTYVPSFRALDASAGGDVVWFDERLQNETYGEVRGSGVLERVEGEWRVAQYNLAFPVPNDRAAGWTERVVKDEKVGEPRGEQHYALDGERVLSMWNKVVPALLEEPSDARPVVVLLPSASWCARATWDLPLREYSVMNALARRGFDVFAVDPGGYGLSSAPIDPPSGGAASAARDLAVAVEHVSELRGVAAVVLVGPSWGAQVAGLYAAQHPERVRGLVLYGARWRSGVPASIVAEHFGEGILEETVRPVTRAAAVADFLPGFHEEDVPRAFATHLLSQARSVPTGALRDFVGELPLIDPSALTMPTALFYGRLEFEVPGADGAPDPSRVALDEHRAEARALFAALPGPRHWIELPRAGHSAHLDVPHGLFQRCLAGWIERLP